MLRLRPSELTLTPDDVEETFRRIALKQTPRAPTAVSPTSGQSGRPVLRRGPQRSTQDAVTALGNIPVLRPLPQRALHTSVDDDIVDSHDDQVALTTDRADSVVGTSPPSQAEHTASIRTSASSAIRGIHLPFRLRRNRQNSNPQSSPGTGSVGATPPAAIPPSPVMFGLNATARATITIESPSQSRPETTDSPAELRGGGKSSKGRNRTISQDPAHTPSSLQRAQTPISSRTQEPLRDMAAAQHTPDGDPPTCYLEGFFKDPNTSPVGIDYYFNEFRLSLPHTEPRRRGGRQPMPMRSLSSGNVPAFALPSRHAPVLMPQPPREASYDSIRTPHRQNHLSSSSSVSLLPTNPLLREQAGTRSRHFSSGASSASTAFSYYGSDLPESRQASSEQPSQDELCHSQHGRSAAMAGMNAESDISNYTELQPSLPRHPSQSSFHMASSSQLSISPLPSMPYTRVQNGQSSVQPSINVSENGESMNVLDATTAAAQNLPSPLDTYSTQYQRMMHAQQAQRTMPVESYSLQHQFDGANGANATRTHHDIDHRHRGTLYSPHAPRTTSHRQTQLPTHLSAHRSSERLPSLSPHVPEPYGRSSQLTRTNQRSSENVPVNTASNGERSARNSQVQIQRAAYEQMSSAVQALQAVNARYTERAASGRTRSSLPHRNPPQAMPGRQGEAIQSGLPVSLPRATHNSTARQSSQQHRGENPHHTDRRLYRQRPAAAPQSLRLHPRDAPLTSLAGSGTTRRRSRSPLSRAPTSMRTHPRMPIRLRNQENSGDAEVALMRREETAIHSRHGGDEQQLVMDETPPRIGRVERRMFE
ncbi:hypothetical protein BKA66DRAFT_463278 [Pyrenochaeta sp. MPI-SDFR-AT-0127]|nr:hypothetical protein BKA66DRAFT_463278 [Pyrenochaeta sp. MPI-SDFR-AT-0127]